MSVIAASVLIQLAAACPSQGVPEWRIVAHAKVESSLNTLALHDNTSRRSYSPASREEAVALARTLLAQGHSLDAGVMQVNSQNWPRLGLTPETVFDPGPNVCAGKAVLAEAYAAERRVSCRYNTGKPDCTNRYPDKIEAAMAAQPVEVAVASPVTLTASAPALPPNRPPAWDVYAAASPRRSPAQTAPVQLTASR